MNWTQIKFEKKFFRAINLSYITSELYIPNEKKIRQNVLLSSECYTYIPEPVFVSDCRSSLPRCSQEAAVRFTSWLWDRTRCLTGNNWISWRCLPSLFLDSSDDALFVFLALADAYLHGYRTHRTKSHSLCFPEFIPPFLRPCKYARIHSWASRLNPSVLFLECWAIPRSAEETKSKSGPETFSLLTLDSDSAEQMYPNLPGSTTNSLILFPVAPLRPQQPSHLVPHSAHLCWIDYDACGWLFPSEMSGLPSRWQNMR